ncbi:hypothetical protein WMY93_011396 [Mugilogobius chulae]|uniref:Uncharacterized protein n=1 Tax=Mugilogobius chulae TaxID=88201 RepID=A0AAW0P2K0_9GOBI
MRTITPFPHTRPALILNTLLPLLIRRRQTHMRFELHYSAKTQLLLFVFVDMGGREEVMVTGMTTTHTMPFQRSRLNRFRLRPGPTTMRKLKPTSLKKKNRDPSPTEMSVEPWPSPPDQAAAEHTQGTLHGQASPTSSEELLDQRPDKLCLDAFWTEVENIRQGSGEADIESTRRDSRHSEDGEEEQWLADAGLSTLISEDSEDSEEVDKAALLSTLTRTQAEAVKRRIESYTLTQRRKNKPPPRDVRDIFNSPISQTLRPESNALTTWHLYTNLLGQL